MQKLLEVETLYFHAGLKVQNALNAMDCIRLNITNNSHDVARLISRPTSQDLR